MNFLKRPYLIRRYGEPKNIRGYISTPYTDLTLPMDVQTLKDEVITDTDGEHSVQALKVFCDEQILVADVGKKQQADRLWFQDKWFECRSSRLSENTPLRHWTCTFIECLKQEKPPKSLESQPESEGDANESE